MTDFYLGIFGVAWPTSRPNYDCPFLCHLEGALLGGTGLWMTEDPETGWKEFLSHPWGGGGVSAHPPQQKTDSEVHEIINI